MKPTIVLFTVMIVFIGCLTQHRLQGNPLIVEKRVFKGNFEAYKSIDSTRRAFLLGDGVLAKESRTDLDSGAVYGYALYAKASTRAWYFLEFFPYELQCQFLLAQRSEKYIVLHVQIPNQPMEALRYQWESDDNEFGWKRIR